MESMLMNGKEKHEVRHCLHEPIRIRLVLCNKLRATSLETTDGFCVFSEQNKCLRHVSEVFFLLCHFFGRVNNL